MKSIIILGGGIQQVPAVAAIREAGYRVIVVDRNPEAPAFATADACLNLAANDIQGISSWILINKQHLKISGIFTLTNQAVSAALIANTCGLPSLSARVVIAAENKLLMKRALQAASLPSARFVAVATLDEALTAYKTLRSEGVTDAYVKVVDGFGGKGVVRVASVEALWRVFPELQQVSRFPELIIEESLSGDFIDVQGFFVDGMFFPAGNADSRFTNERPEFGKYNPVEDFNICPSQLDSSVVEDAYNLLEMACRALELNWGPVGGDFVLTKRGLEIIEIGPRLHGPNGTLQMFPAALGIQPIQFLAQLVCGDVTDSSLLVPRRQQVALCKVFVSDRTDITRVGFAPPALELEGVFASFNYFELGIANIQGEAMLTGVASAFVQGENLAQAIARLARVEQAFFIECEGSSRLQINRKES